MIPQVGNIYTYSEKFLPILYPDRMSAAEVGIMGATSTGFSREIAYWSRVIGKPVGVCNREAPFLVLSVEGNYLEVLSGVMRGWIINEKWLELEEAR